MSILSAMIERFVSLEDTSILYANKIGVELDDKFPEDDFIQQTVEMLAMYRPEGGEFLFDRQAIVTRLTETLNYLEDKQS